LILKLLLSIFIPHCKKKSAESVKFLLSAPIACFCRLLKKIMKEKNCRQIKSCVAFSLLLLFGLIFLPNTGKAQNPAEYRGFWIDTFNTNLNNHADIVAAVNNAKLAKANALFAQVRRRGDSWYLNSLEPTPDGVTFSPAGFDPLADLIATAHAEGIEVHAFVIMSAIWNKNPTVAGGLPVNPGHVFSTRSGFNSATGAISGLISVIPMLPNIRSMF
jgi:uncharacterized lipoprotein YddW (UPF0748 family)